MTDPTPGYYFIFGYLKSGTTWLQVMLDNHPEAVCRGEGHIWDIFGVDLMKIVNLYNQQQVSLATKTFPSLPAFPKFNEDDVYALIRCAAVRLLAKTHSGRPKMIGEKTPDTIKFLEPLMRTFPEAKLIHIVRDGRDAAISSWYHYKRLKPHVLKQKWNNDLDRWLETAAQQWTRENDLADEFARQDADRCHTVRYEDCLHCPEKQISAICDFLGLSTDESSIAACVDAGKFERLSGGRAPGTEDRQSFFRKGVAGEWRTALSPRQVRAYNSIAGDVLKRHRYKSS